MPNDTRDEIRSALLQALADVEGLPLEEIVAAVDAIGDAGYELDSKKAEVVIAALEVVLERQLPGPAALRRDQFNTIGALLDVVAASAVATAAA